jgi:hypothetical protein
MPLQSIILFVLTMAITKSTIGLALLVITFQSHKTIVIEFTSTWLFATKIAPTNFRVVFIERSMHTQLEAPKKKLNIEYTFNSSTFISRTLVAPYVEM